MVKTLQDVQLKNQNQSTITSAEEDSKVSVIESIFAGIGSGLISIPKGVFSLGATLMDLLTAHPMMIVRGQLMENPMYVEPEPRLNANAKLS